MSSCRRARKRVLERLDGTLALEEEFRLERHLGQCEACAAYARRATELEEGLARLPEPPTVRLDVEAAVSAIRARVTDASPAAPEVRRPRRRVAVAALALVALGAWLARSTRDGAAPEGAGAPPELADVLESTAPREPAAVAVRAAPEDLDAPLDAGRLERAREEVRALLLASAERFDLSGGPGDAEELAEWIDTRTRTLRLQGWPVGRIAAGLLEGPDLAAARAAARYLGVRPEPTSAMELRRALQRAELAESCVCALADLGLDGLAGLADALHSASLRDEALAAVVSVGGAEAADVIARELRAEVREGGDASGTLLISLAELGAPAVEELLQLAADDLIDLESFLFGVERVDSAPFELIRRLEERPRGARAEFVLRGAARLAPELATPGLERAATERATRSTAVDCLASIQDPRALMALLRLRESGRVPPAVLDPALRASVEGNSDHLVRAVALAAQREDHDELATLLELVVANEARGAAPVLAQLAHLPILDPELRLTALLALVELGSAEQVELLVELLPTFDTRERRMAAACLMAIHALGGEAAAERALAGADERSRRAALMQLARVHARSTETISLVQLARALAPTLRRPQRDGDGS